VAEKGFKRKLTAILSADVVGYSRLMEAEDMRTVRNLKEHQKLIVGYISQRLYIAISRPSG
jgi:adenylate cyclase